MPQSDHAALRHEFIAWQCRIRQISVRNHAGQPMAAMRPRVSSRKGELLSPALMLLLVPEAAGPSLSFLRFQLQRTAEHQAARDAVIRYLAGEFYQIPELFSDRMTAVFGAGSELAAVILQRKEVLLDFEQYSQIYRMLCKVRALAPGDEAREFSLWQARAFNPNIPGDATVLGFRPDWRSVVSATP